MVNVDPVPGLLHSRTSPPWLASDVLDDRQPQPGAAGSSRAGLVDPEEALEHPLLILRAMPMPRSVTAISTLSPTRLRD